MLVLSQKALPVLDSVCRDQSTMRPGVPGGSVASAIYRPRQLGAVAACCASSVLSVGISHVDTPVKVLCLREECVLCGVEGWTMGWGGVGGPSATRGQNQDR